MPSGNDIIEFLEWLESEYVDCSFVLLPADAITDFPWVRKYAWISFSYIRGSDGKKWAAPKEMPETGDRFFFVARNLSFGNPELLLECLSQKGKIRLDYAESDGRFRKKIPVVPGGAPVDEVTPITILEVDSTSDLLHVRSSLMAGKEKHNKSLVFRF